MKKLIILLLFTVFIGKSEGALFIDGDRYQLGIGGEFFIKHFVIQCGSRISAEFNYYGNDWHNSHAELSPFIGLGLNAKINQSLVAEAIIAGIITIPINSRPSLLIGMRNTFEIKYVNSKMPLGLAVDWLFISKEDIRVIPRVIVYIK